MGKQPGHAGDGVRNVESVDGALRCVLVAVERNRSADVMRARRGTGAQHEQSTH